MERSDKKKSNVLYHELHENDENQPANLKVLLIESYLNNSFNQIKRLFYDKSFSISQSFINLAIVEEKEQKEKENQYLFSNSKLLRDESINSFEAIYTPKRVIPLPYLFDRREQGAVIPDKVFIEGRAGIGKTTLCQYIANQWALGEKGQLSTWAEKFIAVIWIPLRKLYDYSIDDSITLENFIYNKCLDKASRIKIQLTVILNELHAWEANGKVLYLLDGYDEVYPLLQEQSSRNILLQQLLEQENVLITSRPNYSFDSALFERFEVIGFTDANINSYIQQFFADFNEAEKAYSLINYIQARLALKGIAHIPINLELICSVWKENNRLFKDENTNFTLTQLFETIILYLTKRYLEKCDIKTESMLDEDIIEHKNSQSALNFLSELAWKMMQQPSLIVEPSLYQPLLKSYRPNDNEEHSRFYDHIFNKFGVLKNTGESKSSLVRQDYYYIHLMFQEFFAAYFIKQSLILSEGSNDQNEITQLITYNLCNPRFELIWWFTAGLLSKHKSASKIFLAIVADANNNIVEEKRLLHLIRHIEEAQNVEEQLKETVVDSLSQLINAVILRVEAAINQLQFYLNLSPYYCKIAKLDEHLSNLLKTHEQSRLPLLLSFIGNCYHIGNGTIEVLKEFLFDPKKVEIRHSLLNCLNQQMEFNSTLIKQNISLDLVFTLQIQDPVERKELINLISKWREPTEKIIKWLLNVIENDDTDSKGFAIQALGVLLPINLPLYKIYKANTVKCLQNNLLTQTGWMQNYAAKAMVDIAGPGEVYSTFINQLLTGVIKPKPSNILLPESPDINFGGTISFKVPKQSPEEVLAALISTKHQPLIKHLLNYLSFEKAQAKRNKHNLLESIIAAFRIAKYSDNDLIKKLTQLLNNESVDNQVIENIITYWRDIIIINKEIEQQLVRILSSSRPLLTKVLAAETLLCINKNNERIMDVLSQGITVQNMSVRACAIMAVQRLNTANEKLIRSLIDALNTDNFSLEGITSYYTMIIKSLGKLSRGTEEVDKLFIRIAKNNPALRKTIIEALTFFPSISEQWVVLLIEGLDLVNNYNRNDFSVACQSVETLKSIVLKNQTILPFLEQKLEISTDLSWLFTAKVYAMKGRFNAKQLNILFDNLEKEITKQSSEDTLIQFGKNYPQDLLDVCCKRLVKITPHSDIAWSYYRILQHFDLSLILKELVALNIPFHRCLSSTPIKALLTVYLGTPNSQPKLLEVIIDRLFQQNTNLSFNKAENTINWFEYDKPLSIKLPDLASFTLLKNGLQILRKSIDSPNSKNMIGPQNESKVVMLKKTDLPDITGDIMELALTTQQHLQTTTAFLNACQSQNLAEAKDLLSQIETENLSKAIQLAKKQIDNKNSELAHYLNSVQTFHEVCLSGDINKLNSLELAKFSPTLLFKMLAVALQNQQLGVLKTFIYLPEIVLADIKDGNNNNLLHQAATMGDVQAFQLLIAQHDLNPKVFNAQDQQPLHKAIENGHLPIAKMLIEKAGATEAEKKLSYKQQNKKAFFMINDYQMELDPLQLAVVKGHVDIVSYLLPLCAEEDLRKTTAKTGQNRYHGNVLHLAVISCNPAMLKTILFDKKVSLLNLIESKNADGFTPLSLACYVGAMEAISLLIKAKAVLDTRDDINFNTPLHWAVFGLKLEVIQNLCKQVGNPQIILDLLNSNNQEHQRPVDLANQLKKNLKKAAEPISNIQLKLKTLNRISNLLQEISSEAVIKRYQANDFSKMPIRNLVFQGGGAKGLGYIGVLKGLEEQYKQGIEGENIFWDNLQRVAGTSAGAITAMLLAVGYRAKDVEALFSEINILDKLKDFDPAKVDAIKANIGKIQEQAKSSGLFESAQALKEEAGIIKGVKTLYKAWRFKGQHQALFTPYIELVKTLTQTQGICSSDTLRDWFEELLFERTGIHHLTFGELANKVKIDNRFKHLYVIVTQLTPELKIRVFSSEHKGDENVVIADAIRASMSIPFVFGPSHIQIKQNNQLYTDPNAYYVDGGMIKNLPIELFDKVRYQQLSFEESEGDYPVYNKQTLGLSLVNGSTTTIATQATAIVGVKDLALDLINVFWSAETLTNDFWGEPNRAITIEVQGVSTLDFAVAVQESEKLKQLIATGEQAVKAFSSKEPELFAVVSTEINNNNTIKTSILPSSPQSVANRDEKNMLIELIRLILAQHGKDPKALFKALSEQGVTWSRIKQELLFQQGLTNDQRREGKDLVRQLMDKRIELDQILYEEAIKALFPKAQGYDYRPTPDGVVERDLNGFKVKFYKFLVFDQIIPFTEHNPTARPHLIIEIKAPGSQELTSDIDTTLTVKHIDKISLVNVKWPDAWELKGHLKYDNNILLQAALISYYNQLNQTYFNMTSGENRDANVYADGFLNEQGYPKPKASLVGFEAAELTELDISAYQHDKHQLELAASLVSLYEYFELTNKTEEWNNFVMELQQLWADKTNVDAQKTQEFNTRIDKAFKKAKELATYKKEKLEAYIKDKLKAYVSSLQGEALAKDKEVEAMNKLYEQHLLELSIKFAQVQAYRAILKDKKAQLVTIKPNMTSLGQAIEGFKKILETMPDNETIKATISQNETALANLKEQEKKLSGEIKQAFDEYAKLIVEQFEMQVKTNLFANEAYVNQSAPYHVVIGIQSKNTELSLDKKRIVMGSILQEIGFRLLHAEQLRKAHQAEGLILYQTSKYGNRVAEMLFGQIGEFYNNKIFTEDEIKTIKGTGSIKVLARLKNDKKTYHQQFALSEYNVMNADTEFVAKIKKNTNLELDQKASEAEYLFKYSLFKQLKPNQPHISKNDVNSVDLGQFRAKITADVKNWLSIVQKIIVYTFESKIEQKAALWGSGSKNFSNDQQIIMIAKNLNDESIEKMFKRISDANNLTKLDFSNNKLLLSNENNLRKNFLDILRKKEHLEVLQLSNNQLDDQAVLDICKAIQSHKNLRMLDFSFNELSLSIEMKIKYLFRAFKNIEVLLSHNIDNKKDERYKYNIFSLNKMNNLAQVEVEELTRKLKEKNESLQVEYNNKVTTLIKLYDQKISNFK